MMKLNDAKQLHIFKNKWFRLLLVAELFLLVLSVFSLFGKNARYEFGRESFSAMEDGQSLSLDQIALPRGTYQIQLQYECDTDWVNSLQVSDDTLTFLELQTNGGVLYSGLQQTDFEMWLYRHTGTMTVTVQYGGSGTLLVHSLVLQQTNALQRMELFGLLVGILFLNSLLVYLAKLKQSGTGREKYLRGFLLACMVLGIILPFTLNLMLNSGDGGYHLQRIEGIREALRTGQFPIRISPQWVQGHGYASPIFYGETLLLPAGLLRLIGFSVVDAYRIYMAMVGVATVAISYTCFSRAYRNRNTGLLCAFLYSFSVYRIYTLFCRGAFGEALAIMLLPILFYGFLRVFTGDIADENYKKSWIPLTIGFTLLIQTHLLTCEMVGLFTILLCAFCWKKVIRPRTFVVLAKTVIYSTLLSLWYLVPFFDYLRRGDFVINHVSGRRIQGRGVYPAHLLWTWIVAGENTFYDETGMYSSHATAVGPALIAVLVVFFVWSLRKKMYTRDYVMAGFSVLGMILSLSWFPWDRIQEWGGVAATLVSSLQFPFRLLTVPTLMLVGLAGSLTTQPEMREGRIRYGFYLGLVLLTLVGNIYLMDGLVNSSSFVRIYNNEGMGLGYVSGAEYMPYGAPDTTKYVYHNPIADEQVQILDYKKEGLVSRANIINETGSNQSVTFDTLYYPNYVATDTATGNTYPVSANEIFEVQVEIPTGYSGTIELRYQSPWYWRLSEIISLLSLLVLVGGNIASFCKINALGKEKEFEGTEFFEGYESLKENESLRDKIYYKRNILGLIFILCFVSLPVLQITKYGVSNALLFVGCNAFVILMGYASNFVMTKDGDVSLLGSMLWALCPYRLSDLYVQQLSRQSIVWCFAPLFALGLWFFSQNKKWKQGIIAILSFLLVCVAMNYHYVAGALSGKFRQNGMYLYQYVVAFPGVGNSLSFAENGMKSGQALGMGLSTLVLLLAYIYLRWTKQETGRRVLEISALILTGLSLQIFPWDLFEHRNGFMDEVLLKIGSPAKFGILAIGCDIALSISALKYLKGDLPKKEASSIPFRIVMEGIVLLSLITTLPFMYELWNLG